MKITVLKSRNSGKSEFKIRYDWLMPIGSKITASPPTNGKAYKSYRMRDIAELCKRIDDLEANILEQEKLRSGTRLEQSTVCLTVGSGFDSHPDRHSLIEQKPISAEVHGMAENVESSCLRLMA